VKIMHITYNITYHISLLITDRPQLQHGSKMYTGLEHTQNNLHH